MVSYMSIEGNLKDINRNLRNIGKTIDDSIKYRISSNITSRDLGVNFIYLMTFFALAKNGYITKFAHHNPYQATYYAAILYGLFVPGLEERIQNNNFTDLAARKALIGTFNALLGTYLMFEGHKYLTAQLFNIASSAESAAFLAAILGTLVCSFIEHINKEITKSNGNNPKNLLVNLENSIVKTVSFNMI